MSMSSDHTDLILQGVRNSDSLFFVPGGSLLVVMAGMWAFNRIIPNLFGQNGFDPVVSESAYVQEEFGGDIYAANPDADRHDVLTDEERDQLYDFFDDAVNL